MNFLSRQDYVVFLKSKLKSLNSNFFKYLAVGIVAFLSDYLSFYLLYYIFSIPLLYGNSIALITGFVISFFGNRIFVFNANDDVSANKLKKQIVLYAVLLIFNSLFSYVIIRGFIHLGITELIGKITSMAAIVIWNFYLYKKVIFKKLS